MSAKQETVDVVPRSNWWYQDSNPIVTCFEHVDTDVFKKVATLNIDFVSRDCNRAHQNAFGSCDSNFVRQTIEIELTKNFDSQIERILLRSKKWLAMS